ncbi:aldose 1-epimerase family protein [Trichococcus flocculiformis]|uniref:aldose 1-epimerase family protein n=1 Tax=Trichococcus flocculiformis TaxID=82803 RepID=UPI002AAB458D|nr:aldose 1-epimerase family protein [Trichococcus flocculiformis]
MDYVVLENADLRVEILKKGAEIRSVLSKLTDTEYIWQADKNYWGRHAPLLFPIVGKLKDDQFEYNDAIYHMSQHGFARDMTFDVEGNDNDSVKLSLKDTSETQKVFPFKFLLVVEYQLIANRLTTSYSVTNLDNDETMYFSIGAHPGFKVPLESQTRFEDYYIEVSPEKTRNFIPVTEEVLLQTKNIVQTDQSKFELTRELFKDGVIILETAGSTRVTLKSDKSERKIAIDYTDMPYLGLWTTYPDEGEFVCIEPWCGIADAYDSNGKFSEKKGINSLNPETSFTTHYQITFS